MGEEWLEQADCFERAIESNSGGSCAYLSYSPSFNHRQVGCFCFAADKCKTTKAAPDGQDGQWMTWTIEHVKKTWTIEHVKKSASDATLSGAPSVGKAGVAVVLSTAACIM